MRLKHWYAIRVLTKGDADWMADQKQRREFTRDNELHIVRAVAQ
jgi:hypothetical protein